MTDKDIVGYNNDDKNVFHSVGNMYGDALQDLGFVKDPEKLVYQYDNLIRSLGSIYAGNFASEEDRKDFFSYVKDTFLTLALEYDPYSGVDFPGYIARKLKYRVKFSYVNKDRSKRDRVVLLKSSLLDTPELLDYQRLETNSTEYDKKGYITNVGHFDTTDTSLLELVDWLERTRPLTEVDSALFKVMQTGLPSRDKTVKQVQVQFPELTIGKLRDAYDALKRRIIVYYQEA